MLTNMSIFKSMYSGPRTPFKGGGQDQGAGASGSGSKGHSASGSGSGSGNNKGNGKQKGGYNPHTKSGYSQGQQFKGQTVSKDANTQSGGEGGGREAERRRAAMFDRLRAQDMLTKNAATALNQQAQAAAKIAENKKVADEMEAERIAALAKKYGQEESLSDQIKGMLKYGPFSIDEEGLNYNAGNFQGTLGPKGLNLGYSFADGGRIGFEDGSQDPFYTDGNQRLEDLSYSELQELAENMMLMEYDNPVLLDERKREYFRNKYPMNVMGERSTKGIMDEKLLNRLENSRDFKNYIDI